MKWRVNFFDKNGDETRSLEVEADDEDAAEMAGETEANLREWPISFKILDAEKINENRSENQMKWQKIDDDSIVNVWKKTDDDDCGQGPKTVKVPPYWYEQNGTPTCFCGQDMVYSHTEILVKEDK